MTDVNIQRVLKSKRREREMTERIDEPCMSVSAKKSPTTGNPFVHGGRKLGGIQSIDACKSLMAMF